MLSEYIKWKALGLKNLFKSTMLKYGLLGPIEDRDTAIKLFNSGDDDLWGYKGLGVLYDLAFSTKTALELNIKFTKHQSFQPKIDEYNNGKEFKFELKGYWYEVRVTESALEPYWSSFETPYKHSMVNIKVNDKKKLSAKIQQYVGVNHWNIIDINYLRTPLYWYYPLQNLDAKRYELKHERNELKRQKKRSQIQEEGKWDLWDD